MSEKNQLSAEELLQVCLRRGEKTSQELGYADRKNEGVTKRATYTNDSMAYKCLNENTDITKCLSHDDLDE